MTDETPIPNSEIASTALFGILLGFAFVGVCFMIYLLVKGVEQIQHDAKPKYRNIYVYPDGTTSMFPPAPKWKSSKGE